MEREIKFRGKRLDNGEWVYGSLLQLNDESYIYPNMYADLEDIDFGYGFQKVNPDTVGQFTELKDKTGKEIYEGDLLRYPPKDKWEENNFYSNEVFWHNNDCCDRHIGWQMNRIHFYGHICGTSDCSQMKPSTTNKMVIIGNIHDKPDLLK